MQNRQDTTSLADLAEEGSKHCIFQSSRMQPFALSGCVSAEACARHEKTTFVCNHVISAPHESPEVDDFLEDLDEQPVSAQQKEVRCSEFLD